MTTSTNPAFFRERRVQLLVAGGLVMIVALAAFAPRHERALFLDEGGSPSAFGAVALPPPTPTVGTLKRIGRLRGDVLARVFAPAGAPDRLAGGRRIVGGGVAPTIDGSMTTLSPSVIPLVSDPIVLATSEGSTPWPARSGSPASSVPAFSGGGTGQVGRAGGSDAATPAPSAIPATEPAPISAPLPTPATAVPAPESSARPVLSPPAAADPPVPAEPAAAPILFPEPEPVAVPDRLSLPETLPLPMPIPADSPEPAAVVPEPATWAMLILGFGLVGTTLRRSARRRRVVVSAVRDDPRSA